MYSVKSRKRELEATVELLKERLNNGDTSAKTPYEAALFRYNMFRRDWHFDSGFLARCIKKSMRSKVKEKIREDLRLADAIELEFTELDNDMKEVRLLEYARMMKLSKVERKIYFQNRLVFETELAPVDRLKKIMGWILIILYSVGTAFYVCLFGVSKGAQTTNAWLVSFVLAYVQDFFLFIPLKILFMNVYLPGLISKRLASISDPSTAENFKFSSFMPENAAVYVAMNHGELQASKLVMSRGRKDSADEEEAWDVKLEEKGVRGPKGKKLKKMTTARAATKVRALKMYTSKGLAKFGLCFFAAFVLLPEWIQVSLLDVVVPTAVGSVVYGNYQLYKLREWSPFSLNLILITMAMGFAAYIRHRRKKKALLHAHTDHAKHFRQSVILEMAQIQLQSKPGEAIKATGVRRASMGEAAKKVSFGEGGKGNVEKAKNQFEVINPMSPRAEGAKKMWEKEEGEGGR